MTNSLAKCLLLLLGIAYVIGDCWTAKQQCRDRANPQEWQGAIFSPALVMTLALTANGLAFMQEVSVNQVLQFPDGGGTWQLLKEQLAVLSGTGLLFEIVRRALAGPIEADDTPLVAGYRLQIRLYRRLLKEHLLAVLGVGAVFGIASGFGMAAFLACELVLMWAGAVAMLRCAIAKQRRA